MFFEGSPDFGSSLWIVSLVMDHSRNTARSFLLDHSHCIVFTLLVVRKKNLNH